jgi:hypothetical protein
VLPPAEIGEELADGESPRRPHWCQLEREGAATAGKVAVRADHEVRLTLDGLDRDRPALRLRMQLGDAVTRDSHAAVSRDDPRHGVMTSHLHAAARERLLEQLLELRLAQRQHERIGSAQRGEVGGRHRLPGAAQHQPIDTVARLDQRRHQTHTIQQA